MTGTVPYTFPFSLIGSCCLAVFQPSCPKERVLHVRQGTLTVHVHSACCWSHTSTWRAKKWEAWKWWQWITREKSGWAERILRKCVRELREKELSLAQSVSPLPFDVQWIKTECRWAKIPNCWQSSVLQLWLTSLVYIFQSWEKKNPACPSNVGRLGALCGGSPKSRSYWHLFILKRICGLSTCQKLIFT